jgi:hypothetical protein
MKQTLLDRLQELMEKIRRARVHAQHVSDPRAKRSLMSYAEELETEIAALLPSEPDEEF